MPSEFSIFNVKYRIDQAPGVSGLRISLQVQEHVAHRLHLARTPGIHFMGSIL